LRFVRCILLRRLRWLLMGIIVVTIALFHVFTPRNGNDDTIADIDRSMLKSAQHRHQDEKRNIKAASDQHKSLEGKSQPYNVTIVTAYFELPSKHSTEEYLRWMRNMLSLKDPMVIFTERKHKDTILSLRSHAIDRTVIITGDDENSNPNQDAQSLLSTLPIASKTNNHRYPTNATQFWEHQFQIDPEKDIHQSYQLFWIWLSKSYWVCEAIRRNPFSSDIFLWVDIGAFRDTDRYNNKLLVRYPIIPSDSMLFMAFKKPRLPAAQRKVLWFDKTKHNRHFFHSGSLMAGYASVWNEFHAAFQNVLEGYIERDMFIGEDQTVLQSTCIQNPHLCTYINAKEVRRNDNIFFGLRYVVHYGRSYEKWRPPPLQDST